MPILRKVLAALVLAGAAIAAYYFWAPTHHRNALWTIVHDKCVPDEAQNHNPAPCALVNLGNGDGKGYALLKDIRGVAQYLLIPTRRISGIESPELLAPDAPNYLAEAWANRNLVSSRLHRELAWDGIGLAVNSASTRTQDQFHIHIDCVRPEVRAALAQHAGEIEDQWQPLGFDLAGRHYVARRLSAGALASQNPFKLLAEGVRGAAQDMQDMSLAVIGIVFAPGDQGFILLAAQGNEQKGAHSEDLLDRRCAVARTK
jgi:CDP-diacylglycerol pyrophosphatase